MQVSGNEPKTGHLVNHHVSSDQALLKRCYFRSHSIGAVLPVLHKE